MIGRIIDERFRIEAILGRGGMGVVYLATDVAENRSVALKVLHLYLDTENEIAFTRFHREFRVLAQLNHHRIVQTYGYGTYDGIPYLVLERLEGRTLSKELMDGSFLRARLLLIARQICEALVYLHAHSIVHRDLKPGNIMLLPNDDMAEVKLMDFGLVRKADLSVQLTQEGVALGTVAYMAPEQAQGFPVDFRADLYALGVILYEMATGRPPFVHENPAMVLMQQLTSPPPPPRQFNPDIDEPLERLILDLLAKEPSQRPHTTEQLAGRLAQLADESAPVLSPAVKRTDLIPRIPLIGREAVLFELTQCWLKAQTDRGRAVLLSGVAGAGKSRLIDELSMQIRFSNGYFLKSECREYSSLPYQPVITVLDALLHHSPASVRDGIPAEIARLLPGAGADAPDEPASSDPADARSRLFAACWDVMQQRAQSQALLIAIEDVQWADPATLELLDYLIAQVGEAPVLFVLSYRPEEVEPQGGLATLQRDLDRDQEIHTIKLNLLTREDVAKLLQAALGLESVTAGLIDDFYQATNGNPLFVEETLKALAAEGQIAEWVNQPSSQAARLSNMALQLPQNVLSLAERRLQQLSDADRPILTSAAVVGSEFSFGVLEDVTKLNEDTLLDAVDRLLASHLIEELPWQDGEDRYRFAQEALRQALLQTISQRRLRQLHRRAGEAIETRYDIDQPHYWPGLAYHFGMAGDIPRAFRYCVLVGDIAAGMYANVEAIMHYDNALKMAMQAGDESLSSTLQFVHLYTQRGKLLELSTQFDEALANYEEMYRLGQERNDQTLVLAALVALVSLRSSMISPLKDMAQAATLAEQALTLAQRLENRAAEANILRNMMELYLSTERTREAVTYGEQSLAIARELHMREQMAHTLASLQFGYLTVNELEKARDVALEAHKIWLELDDKPMIVDSLTRLNFIYYLRGDYEQVLKTSREAFQTSQDTGYVWGQAFSQILVSYIYLDYGQPERAINVLKEIIQRFEEIGSIFPLASARVDLAWIYATLGATDQGLVLIQVARAQLQREELLPHGVWAWLLLNFARICLLIGDLAAAESALKEANAELGVAGLASFASFVVVLADCELAMAKKEYDRAVTLIDELVPRLYQADVFAYLPEALYLKGKALLAQGNVAGAETALTEARTVAVGLGSRRILWPILSAISQFETDPMTAQYLGQEVQSIVNSIAEHTPADLRDSFLGLPDVSLVVNAQPV